jgi:hypothetical protein
MPAAGLVTLLATYLIVGTLVAGLAVIVTLLTRISRALANATDHLGLIPSQLEPLGPSVSTLVGSLAAARAHADQVGSNARPLLASRPSQDT